MIRYLLLYVFDLSLIYKLWSNFSDSDSYAGL